MPEADQNLGKHAKSVFVRIASDSRRDLYLIFVSLLLWGLGEGTFYIFQPLYLQQLGANPVLIGTVLSLSAVTMSLGHIPLGMLADRIGRRPLIWASWFIGLAGTLIMGLATKLPGYVSGLLLYGLTFCVAPSLSSYVADARGRWSPARALTFTSAGFNAGSLMGPILGGMLADRIGLRRVYLVASAFFLISSVILLFLRKQDLVEKPAGQELWAPLRNRRYLSFLGLLILMIFSFFLPQSFTPNFLQDQQGLSFSQVGELASLLSLGALVFNLGLGHLDPMHVFVLAEAALAVFTLLILRSKGMVAYGAAYLLLGVSRVAITMSSAVVRPMVHPAQIGLAFGILETVKSLAMSLAALVAGVLYAQDAELMYWTALACAILVLVLILLYRRYLYTPVSF